MTSSIPSTAAKLRGGLALCLALALPGIAHAQVPWVSQSRYLYIEERVQGTLVDASDCILDGVPTTCPPGREASTPAATDFGSYDEQVGLPGLIDLNESNRASQTSAFDERGRITAQGLALGIGQADSIPCAYARSTVGMPLSHFSTSLHFDEPARVHLRGDAFVYTHSSAAFRHYAEIRLEGGPEDELIQCIRDDFDATSCGTPTAPWGEPVVLVPGDYVLTAEAYAHARGFATAQIYYCQWGPPFWGSENPAATAASFGLVFEVCTGAEGEPCFPNIPVLSPAASAVLALGLAASGLLLVRSRRGSTPPR